MAELKEIIPGDLSCPLCQHRPYAQEDLPGHLSYAHKLLVPFLLENDRSMFNAIYNTEKKHSEALRQYIVSKKRTEKLKAQGRIKSPQTGLTDASTCKDDTVSVTKEDTNSSGLTATDDMHDETGVVPKVEQVYEDGGY